MRVFCDERTDLGDEHGGRTLSKDSGIWAPETVDALFENVLMVWLVLSKEVLSFRTFGGLSLLLRNLEEGWVLITERPTKGCRSGIDIATGKAVCLRGTLLTGGLLTAGRGFLSSGRLEGRMPPNIHQKPTLKVMASQQN